jgi:hypothetical protein
MSKQKNKKNKAATPKEPITRRELCARIYILEKDNEALRAIHRGLSISADNMKNIAQKNIDIAEESLHKCMLMKQRENHYEMINRVLVLALILSGILHLINIFF